MTWESQDESPWWHVVDWLCVGVMAGAVLMLGAQIVRYFVT